MVVAKREQYYYTERRNPRKTDIKVKKKKSNRKSNAKLRLLCSITIALLICLSLLLRYTHIAQIRMEISNLDKEISNLSSQKDDLQIELDKILESQWLESMAKDQLGMDYPTSSQTVYVNVDEEVFEEETAQEKKQSFVFLKSFRGFINKVFGLL